MASLVCGKNQLLRDFFQGFAASSGNFIRTPKGFQSRHCGFYQVMGIVGPQALGQDVLNSDGFQDGPDSTSGNDARTG